MEQPLSLLAEISMGSGCSQTILFLSSALDSSFQPWEGATQLPLCPEAYSPSWWECGGKLESWTPEEHPGRGDGKRGGQWDGIAQINQISPDLVLALKRKGKDWFRMIVNYGRGEGHSGKARGFWDIILQGSICVCLLVNSLLLPSLLPLFPHSSFLPFSLSFFLSLSLPSFFPFFLSSTTVILSLLV